MNLREYISNIFVVDDIVRKSVDLLNDHFKEDNQTVFIFTADHGMTDWGEIYRLNL
jgi:phosphatidylinositol glycan class N